jgi:hypothetical protein
MLYQHKCVLIHLISKTMFLKIILDNESIYDKIYENWIVQEIK